MAKTETLMLEKIMDIHSLLGEQSAMVRELKESNTIRKSELTEIKTEISKIHDKLNAGEGKIKINKDLAKTAFSIAHNNDKWIKSNGLRVLKVYGGIIVIFSAIANFIFSKTNWAKILDFITGILK